VIRAVVVRPGPARWFFILLAIPAIVGGILTMHFLTGLSVADEHMRSTSAPTAMSHQGVAEPAPMSAEETCGSDCMLTHEMTGIACLMLALLTVVLLLPLAPSLRGPRSLTDTLARIGVVAATLTPRHPPSLIALSISRT